MTPQLRDLLLLSANFLMVVGGTIGGAIVAASLLSAFLERLLGVRDLSLGLAARLSAGVLATMFMWERLIGFFREIGQLAFR